MLLTFYSQKQNMKNSRPVSYQKLVSLFTQNFILSFITSSFLIFLDKAASCEERCSTNNEMLFIDFEILATWFESVLTISL